MSKAITRKMAKELAREGMSLRLELLRVHKKPIVSLVDCGGELYLSKSGEEDGMYIREIDLSFIDTISELEEEIYSYNRG